MFNGPDDQHHKWTFNEIYRTTSQDLFAARLSQPCQSSLNEGEQLENNISQHADNWFSQLNQKIRSKNVKEKTDL